MKHTLGKMSDEALVAWDRDIAPLLLVVPTIRLEVTVDDESTRVVFEGWQRSTTLWVTVEWSRETGLWAPTFPLPFAKASRERQLEALFSNAFEELAESVGCRPMTMRRGDPRWDDLGIDNGTESR